MGRGSALLGWLGLALGVWLLVWGGGHGATAAIRATRMLAYPVEDPLLFALEPGEHEIKVVSWLVQDDKWLRDVRVTTPYCLNFTVLSPDGTVVRRWPLFLRARGGLVHTDDGRLHDPNWLPEDDTPVSDDRLTRVDLTGLTPDGGLVELSPCWTPPGTRVLATVFQLGETTLAQRVRLLRGETSAWHRGVSSRFTPFSWERVPGDWKENLAATTWERLGALQDGAVRVPTEPVMTTFHKGSWLDEAAMGVPVPPGGALAFNLEGPTVFRGSWWTADGATAVNVPTELRVFRGGDRVATASGKVHRVGPIDVDDEVISVEVGLSPDAPGPLVFRAWTGSGDLDRAWGDPPREAPDDRGLQTLAPDFRNLELYRALPETPTEPVLSFPIEEGEWVRVLAFARLPPELPGLLSAPVAPGPGPTLRVRCVDALGQTLSETELATTTEPSIFERYTQFDNPASAAPSVPETLFLQPPPETTALWISADGPIDVGVRVTREPDLQHIVWRGYQFSDGFEADGRWVPLVRNPWRARAPDDLELLLRALRTPRVDAQVRLEEEEEEIPKQRQLLTLRSLNLWQPFEVIAEPGRGGLTRLGKAATAVKIGPSKRLIVEYRVAPEQVGRVVTLRVGNKEIARKLPSAAGTLRLDGLDTGGQLVSVDTPGLFLARAEGRPTWRTMRVERLPAEAGPAIPVPAGSGLILLHPYAERGGGRLQWRLVNARGRTIDSGSMPVSPRGGGAVPMSFEGEGLLSMEALRVRLREDNPGGELYVWTSNPAIYVRATATWGEDRPSTPLLRPIGPAQ